MKEIHKLYKMAGDLTWEKWVQVEATMRLKRLERFTEMDRDNAHVEKLTDPNIFAGCSTEEEKKAALVGVGTPPQFHPVKGHQTRRRQKILEMMEITRYTMRLGYGRCWWTPARKPVSSRPEELVVLLWDESFGLGTP
jgi:hypothetical protein